MKTRFILASALLLAAAFSPLAGQAGVISLGENGALVGSHDPRGEGTAGRID